ncbi:transporter [Sphingomonas aracearum]|uniref:Transporter n=1 Tax=Sphingomonas aracearum TaxID=2283317 RepID=A0A369W3L2_9SPHN|nr:transporter [Sphingomonas aracearum]RDE06651.1 transporter [Sphingomonas aracearum]
MIHRLAALAAFLVATPALAQEEGPRFCPNRPSLGESGCVTEPGHVQLEVTALDWQLDRTPDQREDTVIAGDFQVRLGVTPTGELQVDWTPYGHVRTRDRLTGEIERAGRVGDVQVGWRQNLRNPDGKGLSFALEPSVTLPVGRTPVGDGTWSAGVVLPVTYDLNDKLNLGLTSEADAQANESGHGRHFAALETVTLSYDLSDAFNVAAEVQVVQDNDPTEHVTQAVAAGSFGWQPRQGMQLNALAGVGLNRDTPDVRLLTGASFVF